ncbi:PDZ and LIM domain protein 7-like [Sycon ciliatum]|uniref:PDZ and LIM domain protein 7-like n=1 Tax=Sycon ciliatum TaxID=27933 RepID=UPI0020AD1A64|eukprot:scpid66093/ scgid14315/ LIM domain-binding protein 3; Protein cypher; Z-band alternatively spliced PDZ-motif protein
MSEGEQLTISLSGGGPWGLRLQGGKDFGAPLTIARVTPAGKADKSGVKPNDILVSINGTSTLSIPHIDAQQLVKSAGKALKLELIRGRDLVAHPLSVPTSSASSASSSPRPSLTGRPGPPWQPRRESSGPADAVDELPPPPPFVTDSDTSGATSKTVSPQPPPQPVTPSHTWSQVADGPQEQKCPIPGEVADIAARKSQSPNDGRRVSKDEDVVLGGAFKRLQREVENMEVGDEPVPSALSPGASKTSSASVSTGRRVSGPSTASPASQPRAHHSGASPVTARGASPNSGAAAARATASPPARAAPANGGGASPSVKMNLAANLAKLQASEQLQKEQKSMTDGRSVPRDDAAKRIGVASSRVPVCGGCDSPIDGPYVQAVGKQWHAEHFVCSSCGTQLRNCPFVEHEGKMFCEKCYTEYFASRCSVCSKTVKGECVSAGGKEMHPACFRCVRCGSSLAGQGFHEQDGNFYCSDDYEALFSVICTGCEQPVKNNELWVEALGGQWHETCFLCTVCHKPLQGGRFFAKLGRPYCKDHA